MLYAPVFNMQVHLEKKHTIKLKTKMLLNITNVLKNKNTYDFE